MISSPELAMRTRTTLETDRVWSAYALADLDPAESHHCTWLVGQQAVILAYRGLTPPVLFACGAPAEVSALLREVTEGEYIFTLLLPDRAALSDRLRVHAEHPTWRMALRPADFRAAVGQPVPLGPDDLEDMLSLFADHPDRPDAFHERQLAQGLFFGVRERRRLVAVAGTHVVSSQAGVAAIGNVFTRPDRRGRGLGAQTTSAVAAEAIRRGLRTIVLNVWQDNQPAIRCYRRLGFREHCPYAEGSGYLAPSNSSDERSEQ
jgi:ribosomal protein S18 acetylase RimI-like enzyme